MTPQECRNETNLQRVRIFKNQDLNKATLTEKWDRVRVVCTQPFNKHLQYGISFITIHAPEESSSKVQKYVYKTILFLFLHTLMGNLNFFFLLPVQKVLTLGCSNLKKGRPTTPSSKAVCFLGSSHPNRR